MWGGDGKGGRGGGVVFCFFKQKTAYEIYQCDWSSDVCSSDLSGPAKLDNEMTELADRSEEQRKRIVKTAIILGAVALAFFVSAFFFFKL